MKRYLKRFGIDIAGYLLILVGLSLGWLPGPGGIPLVLAGLGLLSIHNPWAKRIMRLLARHGNNLTTYIFPENRTAQLLHDIVTALLLCAAMVLVLFAESSWHLALAGILFVFACLDYCLNRQRLARFRSSR